MRMSSMPPPTATGRGTRGRTGTAWQSILIGECRKVAALSIRRWSSLRLAVWPTTIDHRWCARRLLLMHVPGLP
jgi:hypothetical protein